MEKKKDSKIRERFKRLVETKGGNLGLDEALTPDDLPLNRTMPLRYVMKLERAGASEEVVNLAKEAYTKAFMDGWKLKEEYGE